jgi:hypothetical protein
MQSWASLPSGDPLILAAMVGPLGLAIYAVVKVHTQIINFFKSLPGRLAGYASAAVTAVLGFFEKLPLRLAFIIGFMLGLWVRLWLNIFPDCLLDHQHWYLEDHCLLRSTSW